GGGPQTPGVGAPLPPPPAPPPDGLIFSPVGPDNFIKGEVQIEPADSDGIPNVSPEPFRVLKKERIPLTAYAKIAATNPELKVSVRGVECRDTVEGRDGREIGDGLYLTLGARLPDLQKPLAQ